MLLIYVWQNKYTLGNNKISISIYLTLLCNRMSDVVDPLSFIDLSGYSDLSIIRPGIIIYSAPNFEIVLYL